MAIEGRFVFEAKLDEGRLVVEETALHLELDPARRVRVELLLDQFGLAGYRFRPVLLLHEPLVVDEKLHMRITKVSFLLLEVGDALVGDGVERGAIRTQMNVVARDEKEGKLSLVSGLAPRVVSNDQFVVGPVIEAVEALHGVRFDLLEILAC